MTIQNARKLARKPARKYKRCTAVRESIENREVVFTRIGLTCQRNGDAMIWDKNKTRSAGNLYGLSCSRMSREIQSDMQITYN